MKRVDLIELIYSFLSLEKNKNFQLAAEELGISKSTLSRRISSLEQELGCTLIIRGESPCHLTEQGVIFLKKAGEIAGQYEQLNFKNSDKKEGPSGTIYISSPNAIGNGLLIEWIKQFQDLYPGIIIDLTLTLGPVRMLPPECDIRVNHEQFPSERVIARPLGSMLRMMVASEAYLAQKGLPKTPADLINHNLLGGNDLIADSKLRLTRGHEHVTIPYFPKLRLKDHGAARSAAVAGLGISVHAFKYDSMELVKRGQLCEVLPEWEPDPSPVSLLMPQNKPPSEIALIFADFIEQRWQSHPYLTTDV